MGNSYLYRQELLFPEVAFSTKEAIFPPAYVDEDVFATLTLMNKEDQNVFFEFLPVEHSSVIVEPQIGVLAVKGSQVVAFSCRPASW